LIFGALAAGLTAFRSIVIGSAPGGRFMPDPEVEPSSGLFGLLSLFSGPCPDAGAGPVLGASLAYLLMASFSALCIKRRQIMLLNNLKKDSIAVTDVRVIT
jgi:hypothetical protein